MSLQEARSLLKDIQDKKFCRMESRECKTHSGKFFPVISTDIVAIQMDPRYAAASEFIKSKYEAGYGMTGLINSFDLPITYSVLRRLLIEGLFGVSARRGNNVVTDRVRELRKERAIKQANDPGNKFGKPQPTTNYTNRGIQGSYYSATNKKSVWLRSTWEYIFAKWLDSHGISWLYECYRYKLPDNSIYKPDFFLLDAFGNIKQVVEIKGYWRSREYKVDLLKAVTGLDIVIVRDINPFIENGSTYEKEKLKWKKLRSNQCVSKESLLPPIVTPMI